MKKLFLSFIAFTSISFCNEPCLFWWHCGDGPNFGDDLSRVIVEKMLGQRVTFSPLESPQQTLLAAGSILHYARDGDVIWGSGFREDPTEEHRFTKLDVRAVRGPRTRQFLLQKGIDCPAVYGDPALLMSYLFPELIRKEPEYDYIIIPNLGEIPCFLPYKNMVSPLEPWQDIVDAMLRAKFVISSSLHGIIVAEALGVPARLLKMTWIEPLLKYQDYYESTGRPYFRYATSVQEALLMGGEAPPRIDLERLLQSFPWDYFQKKPIPLSEIREH